MDDDFIAQAQRFVRSAVFCAVTLGLAFGGWCSGVPEVAVALGFAFQAVLRGCVFRDKFQLKWQIYAILVDVGVCSQRVEVIPNVWCGAHFVEANVI